MPPAASATPYTVLARKYRSRTFDEVVGQEPIAQTLKKAIETGRVHHAYLFTGTRGVGKTSMARILLAPEDLRDFGRLVSLPATLDDQRDAAHGGAG